MDTKMTKPINNNITGLSSCQEKSSFKIIDLFAGVGGIRLGFQKAFKNDVKFVFSSEMIAYGYLHVCVKYYCSQSLYS